MRRSLAVVLVATFALLGGARAQEDDRIRYLGIGNSFTWDSTHYLGEIARSQGVSLDYFVAGIGGGSLEDHVMRLRAYEADPSDPFGRPYRREGSDGVTRDLSLAQVLGSEPWDVVSIQQVSWKSIDYASYEPFAGELIQYIRKRAPQAEIVIHMTWAYRGDHPWFTEGELTQVLMYQRLKRAYKRLASEYGLRIVPIGEAMHEARQDALWRFAFPDPDFNYERPEPEALPQQEGSLNVGWRWREEEDGGRSFGLDATHANAAGRYLGGLVHFGFLFGEPPGQDAFRPEILTMTQSLSLRAAAEKALGDFEPFNRGVAADAEPVAVPVVDGPFWRIGAAPDLGELKGEDLSTQQVVDPGS